MLLHPLDTPADLSQWMAFSIASRDVVQLKEALRQVIESADMTPLVQLWREHEAAYRERFDRIRFCVDATWLASMCALARQSHAEVSKLDDAMPMPLDPRLDEIEAWLRNEKSVALLPERWFDVAVLHDLENELAMLREAPSIIAQSRVGALIDGLCALRDDRALGTPQGPVEDLSWLRGVQFRTQGQTQTTDRVRESGNALVDVEVVGVPASFTQVGTSAFVIVDEVRAALALDSVLTAIIGAWRWCEGPGPFLQLPPQARAVEEKTWKRLPFFAVDHWAWTMCDAYVIAHEDLESAAQWVRTARIVRGAELDNRDEIDDAEWNALVAEHWPRCKERFLKLLADARTENRAVILMRNDRSHPHYPGVERPVEVLV